MLILIAGRLSGPSLHIPGIDTAFGWVSLLRVHLNLAFYLTFSTLLLLIWLFVIVFVDHFTWWRFSPGQVIEEHRIGQATGHAYNTEGMVVRRLPDDLFRHRILGSAVVGAPATSWSSRPTRIPSRSTTCGAPGTSNVCIENMIATRITEQAVSRP